jgi:hypothetical protein
MAYVTPLGDTETHKEFKLHVYKDLQTLANAERGDQEMRVIQKHPPIPWKRVWTTLHMAWLSERLKSLWYTIIHEIVPTKERLEAIHLSGTELCNQCGNTDTLQHRIRLSWRSHKMELGPQKNCSTTPHRPPKKDNWTIRPLFRFEPPKRQTEIVQIIAHLVEYMMQRKKRFTLIDYIDFVHRAKCKA